MSQTLSSGLDSYLELCHHKKHEIHKKGKFNRKNLNGDTFLRSNNKNFEFSSSNLTQETSQSSDEIKNECVKRTTKLNFDTNFSQYKIFNPILRSDAASYSTTTTNKDNKINRNKIGISNKIDKSPDNNIFDDTIITETKVISKSFANTNTYKNYNDTKNKKLAQNSSDNNTIVDIKSNKLNQDNSEMAQNLGSIALTHSNCRLFEIDTQEFAEKFSEISPDNSENWQKIMLTNSQSICNNSSDQNPFIYATENIVEYPVVFQSNKPDAKFEINNQNNVKIRDNGCNYNNKHTFESQFRDIRRYQELFENKFVANRESFCSSESLGCEKFTPIAGDPLISSHRSINANIHTQSCRLNNDNSKEIYRNDQFNCMNENIRQNSNSISPLYCKNNILNDSSGFNQIQKYFNNSFGEVRELNAFCDDQNIINNNSLKNNSENTFMNTKSIQNYTNSYNSNKFDSASFAYQDMKSNFMNFDGMIRESNLFPNNVSYGSKTNELAPYIASNCDINSSSQSSESLLITYGENSMNLSFDESPVKCKKYDNSISSMINNNSVKEYKKKTKIIKVEGKTKRSVSNDAQNKSRYATRFSAYQNQILLEWYSNNQEMPYASDCTINNLAMQTELSEKSVRKWLSNKRSRKNNTNRLSVVVAYKKNRE